MTYGKWDIIVIPFPFSDSANSKPRPAVVISDKKFNDGNKHVNICMIKTASNTSWLGDHEIFDLESCGLKSKSFIRLKLASFDLSLKNKKIGALSKKDVKEFQQNITKYIF